MKKYYITEELYNKILKKSNEELPAEDWDMDFGGNQDDAYYGGNEHGKIEYAQFIIGQISDE